MAAQDAILKLILQNDQLRASLADAVRQWVEATRRMDTAANEVDFNRAKQEADLLRQKVEALAATVVKDFARIDAANKQLATQFGTSAANVRKVETAISQLASKANKDFDKIRADADKIQLKRLQDSIREVNARFNDLDKAAEKAFRKATQEAEKVRLQRVREEAQAVSREIANIESAAARHFKAAEALAKSSGAQIHVGLGGGLTRVGGNLQQLRARFEATIAAMRSAADRPTFERLRAQALELQQQITRLGNQSAVDLDKMRQASQQASAGVSTLSQVSTRLRGVLASLGVVLSVRQLVQFGEDAIQTSIRVQALEAQLSAAAGTQERYSKLQEFAHGQAERLGFDFEVLAQSTARFEAATRLAGISEEGRLNVLRSTIETARVLQLSNQRLNNTLLALEQIASKGTVSMEELRRQLGDNVPGAVQILAKELNVTVAELFKMIETNKVLSSEALPALARGFDKAFGAGLPVALRTTATAIGQVQKELLDLKVVFASAFGEELTQGIREATESLRDLQSLARVAGQTIGAESGKYLEFFKGVTRAITAFEDSFRESTNPVNTLLNALDAGVQGFIAFEAGVDAGRLRLLGFDERAREAAQRARDLGTSLRSLTEETNRLREAKLAESVKENNEALEVMSSRSERLREDLEDLTETINTHGDETGELTEEQTRLAEEVEDLRLRMVKLRAETGILTEESKGLNLQILTNAASQEILSEKSSKLERELKKVTEQKKAQGGASLELAQREEELTKELERVRSRTEELIGEEEELTGIRISEGRSIEELVGLVAALKEERKRETEGIRARISAEEELNDAFAAGFEAQRKAREEVLGSIAEIQQEAEQLIDAAASLRGGLAGLNISDEIAEIVEILGQVGPATDEQIARLKEFGNVTVEQVVLFRDKIQEVLDGLREAGGIPSEAFLQLADQFGVTTTIVEKELEKQSKAAEKAAKEEEQAAKRRIQALERIGDAFLKLSEQLGKGGGSDGLADLQKQLDALRDEEQELTFGIEADPERLQEVQEEIESVREQIRNFTEDQTALGEETAKTADIIDDAIRGLVDQITPLLGSLTDSQELSIQSILKNLQALGADGVATGDDVSSALQQMVEVFQSAGLPVEELQSALSELQTGTLDIEKAFAAARREFEEGGEALGDVRARIDELKDSNKELLVEVEKGKKLYKEFADAADSELKRAATAYDALLTRQRESLDLCAALKDCLAGAG